MRFNQSTSSDFSNTSQPIQLETTLQLLKHLELSYADIKLLSDRAFNKTEKHAFGEFPHLYTEAGILLHAITAEQVLAIAARANQSSQDGQEAFAALYLLGLFNHQTAHASLAQLAETYPSAITYLVKLEEDSPLPVYARLTKINPKRLEQQAIHDKSVISALSQLATYDNDEAFAALIRLTHANNFLALQALYQHAISLEDRAALLSLAMLANNDRTIEQWIAETIKSNDSNAKIIYTELHSSRGPNIIAIYRNSCDSRILKALQTLAELGLS